MVTQTSHYRLSSEVERSANYSHKMTLLWSILVPSLHKTCTSWLYSDLIVPKCIATLAEFTSSLKPMCILLLLSFWSLTDSSVNILTPTGISYRSGSSSLHMHWHLYWHCIHVCSVSTSQISAGGSKNSLIGQSYYHSLGLITRHTLLPHRPTGSLDALACGFNGLRYLILAA